MNKMSIKTDKVIYLLFTVSILLVGDVYAQSAYEIPKRYVCEMMPESRKVNNCRNFIKYSDAIMIYNTVRKQMNLYTSQDTIKWDKTYLDQSVRLSSKKLFVALFTTKDKCRNYELRMGKAYMVVFDSKNGVWEILEVI